MKIETGQGQNVKLNDNDLKIIQKGLCYPNSCPDCGYQVSEEHNYCPKCGKNLQE